MTPTNTFNVEIKSRWSDRVIFTAALDAKYETSSLGVRLGLAVRLAYKSNADLSDADLSGAVLRGADLSGAVLSGAVLSDAVLSGAVLSEFKTDLIAEILKLPDELENLRDTLVAGKIDGSTYEGECACLAGTIANKRGIAITSGQEIKENGVAFRADSSSPRERWFMNISKGDTPESNSCAKLALEWIEEAISMRDHIRATAQKEAA